MEMKDRQYPGYLISFEGGEGSGKTSGLRKVHEKLKWLGVKTRWLREPGGPKISEETRQIIIKEREVADSMDGLTETFLFQASRRQLSVSWVWPFLLKGDVVLIDRFRDSSVVYQGFARGIGCGRIDRLNNLSTNGLEPDLTILFDVEPEIGLARRGLAGEVNRLDAEKLEFHQRVNWAYRQLAEFDRAYSENPRWEMVNANLSQEEVLASVIEIVERKLVGAEFIEGRRRGVEY